MGLSPRLRGTPEHPLRHRPTRGDPRRAVELAFTNEDPPHVPASQSESCHWHSVGVGLGDPGGLVQGARGASFYLVGRWVVGAGLEMFGGDIRRGRDI